MNKLFLDISSIILFKPYMTMWRIFYALDRKELRLDLLLVYLFYDIIQIFKNKYLCFQIKVKTVIRNCYTANKKSLWGFFFSKKKKKENDNNNVTKKKSIKFSTTHLPCKFDFNILDIALGHMEVKTWNNGMP